jgi:ADP-ribosylglycohydrolase
VAIASFVADYRRAIGETIRVGGDIDTNAAIGGVVCLAAGRECIPPEWLQNREVLK